MQSLFQKITPNQNVKYYITSNYKTLKEFADNSYSWDNKYELFDDNILRRQIIVNGHCIAGGVFIVPQHELENNVDGRYLFEVTIPILDAEFYEVKNCNIWGISVEYYACVVIVKQILDLFDTDVINRVGLKISDEFIEIVARWDNIELLNFLYDKKLLSYWANDIIVTHCNNLSTLEWLEAKKLIDFKYEEDNEAAIKWLRENG